MALCSLVGRLSYKHLCTTDLDVWMEKTWRPLLGYVPSLSHLGRGWIYFQFKSPKDSTSILECLWTLDDSSLMLKHWRVIFDPSQDYFRLRHLWVLLPGLPLYLWNEKSLMAIGNSLGRFISVDPKTLVGPDKKLVRILVELDLHEGLLETLDIDWRGHLTRQKLDYLDIPFRCSLCRQTGHLRKTCTGAHEDELSEESMLELASNLDSPVAHTQVHIPDYPDDGVTSGLDSITGKLKSICLTLFFSLSTWEKDLLDNSPLLNLGSDSFPRGDSPREHSESLPSHLISSLPNIPPGPVLPSPHVHPDTHSTLITFDTSE
jgi:hypothetical protein